MASGRFPAEPGSRKAILVLDQHELERCSYEPGAAQALLDDEAFVLRFPVQTTGEIAPALQNILDARLARPGAILVQSPYDPDLYEDAARAGQRFALAKHMIFSTLCMHLGARAVTVEQIDVKTSTGKQSFEVKGERQGVTGEMGIESDELERLRSQIHLRDEFTGGAADLNAAETLLKRTGLFADPAMRTLLDMRRASGNRLTSRKLALSLSSEARSNLNVVGRLKVPAFLKLSAEYDSATREQSEYTLTVLVTF